MYKYSRVFTRVLMVKAKSQFVVQVDSHEGNIASYCACKIAQCASSLAICASSLAPLYKFRFVRGPSASPSGLSVAHAVEILLMSAQKGGPSMVVFPSCSGCGIDQMNKPLLADVSTTNSSLSPAKQKILLE